jgi:hypothetical protein
MRKKHRHGHAYSWRCGVQASDSASRLPPGSAALQGQRECRRNKGVLGERNDGISALVKGCPSDLRGSATRRLRSKVPSNSLISRFDCSSTYFSANPACDKSEPSVKCRAPQHEVFSLPHPLKIGAANVHGQSSSRCKNDPCGRQKLTIVSDDPLGNGLPHGVGLGHVPTPANANTDVDALELVPPHLRQSKPSFSPLSSVLSSPSRLRPRQEQSRQFASATAGPPRGKIATFRVSTLRI